MRAIRSRSYSIMKNKYKFVIIYYREIQMKRWNISWSDIRNLNFIT